MKKFFESQTAADGNRRNPLTGINLLLIGAILCGSVFQTVSVWANDAGISYSQKRNLINLQQNKEPNTLMLVPREDESQAKQANRFGNTDRSKTENNFFLPNRSERVQNADRNSASAQKRFRSNDPQKFAGSESANYEVSGSRKSEFGVIRPVGDVVARESVSTVKGKRGAAQIITSASKKRVISSYAGGSVGDTIEDLEMPYQPADKKSSDKKTSQSVDTAELLLDSEFSVDDLLADEKMEHKKVSPQKDNEIKTQSKDSDKKSSFEKMKEEKELSEQNNADEQKRITDTDNSGFKMGSDFGARTEPIPSRSELEENKQTKTAAVPDKEKDLNAGDQKTFAQEEKTDGSKTGSPDEMLLASRQSPVIDIRTFGPKKIIVGQDSLYQIRVRNTSSIEARKLVITTDIPSTVDVVDAQSTTGNTNLLPVDSVSQKQQNLWQIELLAPGSEEILSLTLIPKQRVNFNLDCRYDFEQTGFQTGIEVQEAVLELQIDGRDTIEWGAEDKYRLRLRNTGNGDAENVRLLVSTGDNEQAAQFLNLLKAGEEKVMDLSVRTMLDKEIVLGAEVSSGPGLSAKVSKTVKILRGHLRVSVEAPELQFVNNNADYFIRLQNDGTAVLKNVDISAVLSEGCRFVSCTGSGQEIPGRNQIVWKIPTLNIGEETVLQIVGQMVRSGSNRIDVSVSDKTGLSAISGAMTKVDAIASLNLRINAPNGPAAVGSPVYYEVVISNNGTKAAENVNAGIMFTQGIKALEIEGGQGRIKDDHAKVFFNPVRILSAGQSVSWRVKAQPVLAGSHKTVAVVEAVSENIRLNSEEITYCYQRQGNGGVPDSRQSVKLSRPGTDLFGDAVETPAAPSSVRSIAGNKVTLPVPAPSSSMALNSVPALPSNTANSTNSVNMSSPSNSTVSVRIGQNCAQQTAMPPIPTLTVPALTQNVSAVPVISNSGSAAPVSADSPLISSINTPSLEPQTNTAASAPVLAGPAPLVETKSVQAAAPLENEPNKPVKLPVLSDQTTVSQTASNQATVELQPTLTSPSPIPTLSIESNETSLLKYGPVPYSGEQKRF